MEKIEETIKEIAIKHGIAVGRDDPIMILHTINERLMKETAAVQRQILHEFKEELESAAHLWETNAKSISEKILGAALSSSKEVMEKVMVERGERAAVGIGTEVESKLTNVEATIKNMRTVILINALTGIMTLFVLIAVL